MLISYTEVFKLSVVALLGVLWIFSSKQNENIVAKNIIRKLYTYYDGILFMALSSDAKGIGPKKNPDPDLLLKQDKILTKTIVFLRHGESDWNDIFNKGIGPSMLVRLVKAMIMETRMLLTMDSIFIDSPLNNEGFEQAKSLAKYMDSVSVTENMPKEDALVAAIAQQSVSSVIVASNLRRAIATTTVALWPRVTRSKEKIHILSSLQEISRNIDTRALAPARGIPDLSRIAQHCEEGFDPEQTYDYSENLGNKTYTFRGIKRLRAFNDWAFKREEDVIVVGGHSLWFRAFFQTFLPFSCDHVAKKQKIVNSGLVAFTLQRAEMPDGQIGYRIDPDSMMTLYGGYSAK